MKDFDLHPTLSALALLFNFITYKCALCTQKIHTYVYFLLHQVPPRESWNGELLGYTVNCTEEKQNINYISQNVTSTKTITVHGWASTKTTINNLRTYTRYSIAVRAINSYGPGPWSASMYGITVEGTPEAAPQNVNCSALSSQSIKIVWQEPPLQFHGGIIQGYKIVYRPLLNQCRFNHMCVHVRTLKLSIYEFLGTRGWVGIDVGVQF